ncbi:HesA/MoeB/ThiF family protein [Bacteroides fluxus]|jgi:molybdopterin/thiamine biosynthesis adenylyltransferase|uniref:ThiF family protein n=1 Tax=Bacteroides fluxus YIT 12057 TaxID=763034 RepID=F3PTQ5_9BACE|nr:HesA/MoeB/ThiF family protein [Bacteroides fluxus]EGF56703.1 ThiF family protein [Bacteroides fluxus YIT 12057]
MNRYSRQISLPEIGKDGQKKLQEARVLIVGVGGLGSPVALYLAGAGVGTLGLIDDDVVSISNLQRQVLYTEAEVGQSKVQCAAKRLQALNSGINLEIYPFRLDRSNAGELIGKYDIIVDGCDNFATRYLLSDTCASWGKAYVYGAIQGLTGQVSVFCQGEHSRTYRDLYPDEQGTLDMPAPDNSVVGTTPAVVGSLEANEVLKLICGYGETLAGKLWTIDLRTMQSYILSI